MKLTLKRIAKTGHGVFGVLLDDFGFPFALTAERPDLNNQSDVSCIPAGTYSCKKIISNHFGACIEVQDVPDRSHILFHKGNIPMTDSKGCILVGEQFENVSNRMAVQASRHGFNQLMAIADDEFDLLIMEL